ncbi:tryptophan-rich sensory protein [Candidatus Gottesmanbacteria bacterium]|nr:tryptophan-rich sensory protein [Candidatus Gottesmanbacteria bacterium]
MKQFPKLLFAIILCESVGILATPITISAIENWYNTLNKPYFSPPNWVFGPVWTLLYLMMGISLYLVWMKGWKKKKVQVALVVFLIQLGANFLWSLLFFGLHSPLLGFIDIIFLLLSLGATIYYFYCISKTAAYLLIPYFLWVSFASILNLSVLLLNSY